jgi:hypothetical protein
MNTPRLEVCGSVYRLIEALAYALPSTPVVAYHPLGVESHWVQSRSPACVNAGTTWVEPPNSPVAGIEAEPPQSVKIDKKSIGEGQILSLFYQIIANTRGVACRREAGATYPACVTSPTLECIRGFGF